MKQQHAKTIRASETVSPYSPGAIVDILGQSFMAPTADTWVARHRKSIASPRLASAVGVEEFWGAPTTESPENQKSPSLTFCRFPGWLFCQSCRLMQRWSRSYETGSTPQCRRASCDGKLVPMRFVAVCSSGSHIQDIDWAYWVHRNSNAQCRDANHLRFDNNPDVAEGLRSLEVRCGLCGARRNLGELNADVLKREGITCRGRQPWQWDDGLSCGRQLVPVQRGATNLHFADVVSAIDIPAVDSRIETVYDEIVRDSRFRIMQTNETPDLLTALAKSLADQFNVSVDVIMSLSACGAQATTPDMSVDIRSVRSNLLSEEFEAFLAAANETAPMQDFLTRPAKFSSRKNDSATPLSRLITDIVMVDRLRDVRASLGFRRYTPEAQFVKAVNWGPTEARWLPASEGYGEGVFLKFDGASVQGWAVQPVVMSREEQLCSNQAKSELGLRLHIASAPYVMLHTFAHLLMNELAFESGYTAASIRERIYCESEGDFGIFLYTTTTDVEGTLGGLVRLGEPDLLARSIVRTLERAAWCPNDPVCIESEAQSIDGLNFAACHACCLAAETSCESSNLLLDRALVVGGEGVQGFFEPVLEQMLGRRLVPTD